MRQYYSFIILFILFFLLGFFPAEISWGNAIQDFLRQSWNANPSTSKPVSKLKLDLSSDKKSDLRAEERNKNSSRQEFIDRLKEVSLYQEEGIQSQYNGIGVREDEISVAAPAQTASTEPWWKIWKHKESGGPKPFNFQAHCGISELDANGEGLQCWLGINTSVLEHLIWQDVNEQTGQVYSQSYPYWSYSKKQQLAEAVYQAYQRLKSEDFSGLSLTNPPANLLTLNDYNYPCNRFSKYDAWKLYLSTVAHSLALEMSGLVPWSFLTYSSTDQDILLNSKYFYQAGNINCQTFDDEAHTIPRNFQFYGYSSQGRVIPQLPTAGFSFLVENNLIGPNHLNTITKLLQWSHEMYHYLHGFTTLNVEYYWKYRGGVPAIRVMEGTQMSDPQAEKSFPGVYHWTAGCRGSTEFFRSILRNVNIPVQVYQEECEGHFMPIFWTIQMALDHGDNPYSETWVTTPPISAKNILIPISTFQQWFSNGHCAVSRQLAEIAVKYISDILVDIHCEDLKDGLSQAQGKIFAYLSNFFTMQELNQKQFWSRLNEKAVQLGVCTPSSYSKPAVNYQEPINAATPVTPYNP